MRVAKLFMNGRSQAVRLPREFRFEGEEVFIKKTRSGILLIPKDQSVWDTWEKNLMKHEEPFLPERNQPGQQKREGLDELFD